MGFDLSGGFAAGGGADALESILKQAFIQQMERKRLALDQSKLSEDARQANQTNALGQGRLGIDRDELTQRTRQYDEGAPLRSANLKHIGAETTDLEGRPAREQAQRDFTTTRDASLHGYDTQTEDQRLKGQLRVVGAHGANARALALMNNDARAELKNPATDQQANEVADSIALIDQMSKDKSLSHAVGPLDQYAGGVINADPNGVNRFKALHDQLVGKMSLAQAGKLRGQGQISDKERAMLASAATALNRGLSEKDYLAELAKVRDQFARMQGGAPVAPAAGGGGFRVVEIK